MGRGISRPGLSLAACAPAGSSARCHTGTGTIKHYYDLNPHTSHFSSMPPDGGEPEFLGADRTGEEIEANSRYFALDRPTTVDPMAELARGAVRCCIAGHTRSGTVCFS